MDYSKPLYIGIILGTPHMHIQKHRSEGVSAKPLDCGHMVIK